MICVKPWGERENKAIKSASGFHTSSLCHETNDVNLIKEVSVNSRIQASQNINEEIAQIKGEHVHWRMNLLIPVGILGYKKTKKWEWGQSPIRLKQDPTPLPSKKPSALTKIFHAKKIDHRISNAKTPEIGNLKPPKGRASHLPLAFHYYTRVPLDLLLRVSIKNSGKYFQCF